MEGSSIRIGQLAFDYSEYDPLGDVLYLHNDPWGFPIERDHETTEGHMLCLPADSDEGEDWGEPEIIALALIEPRQRARREGHLLLTIPTTPTPRIIRLSDTKVELIIAGADPVPPPKGYDEGDE